MTIPPRAARNCWHAAINPLHATIYFSPDLGKEFAALGVTERPAVNLASRSAAMGAVGAGTVTATFYNYRHDFVARHLPAVWDTITPEQALDARLRAADSTLRRLLGAETIESPSSPRPPTSPCAPPRAAPGTPGPCTPPMPTSLYPRSRTCACGTPPPCCANTAATATSRPCCSPGWTRWRPWSATPPPAAA